MLKKLILSVMILSASSLLQRAMAESMPQRYIDADSLKSIQRKEIDEYRLNRGLVSLDTPFVSKGQWIVGSTASYSNHLNNNYTLAIVDGISSEGYNVDISPMVAYTVKKNLAVGLRFEYGRSLLNLDNASLSISNDESEINIDIVDYYALEHTFTGMMILRQYIPLGQAKRFALFVETQLEFGGFKSKFAFDQPVTGTYSKGYNVGIGVVPGIVAFATNNVAFEVCVGMMGLGYRHTDQVHNQVYSGEVDSSFLNFKVNLLSIGLGVAFYL